MYRRQCDNGGLNCFPTTAPPTRNIVFSRKRRPLSRTKAWRLATTVQKDALTFWQQILIYLPLSSNQHNRGGLETSLLTHQSAGNISVVNFNYKEIFLIANPKCINLDLILNIIYIHIHTCTYAINYLLVMYYFRHKYECCNFVVI